jgi:hypothetical protein
VAFPYAEFDLSDVETYPLGSRTSKTKVADFATPHTKGSDLGTWLGTLPRMLGAEDIRAVVEAMVAARASGGGIIWGFGAHVIKTGLAPILIDLAERGFVSAFATNGAGIIHDFEIAWSGSTSEDVDDALGRGRFGMADETGRLLNQVIRDGMTGGLGLGQSVGAYLSSRHPPYAHLSIAASAARLGIPLTAHVALGTDIIHMHPDASGAAIGDTSLRDFRYFVSNVAALNRGVYLNCGSAVVLPEVFLKAVALARNRGIPLTGLTTVNIDFIRMYRAQTNVIVRPPASAGGRGFSLIGHHEILIPLLAAALIEAS